MTAIEVRNKMLWNSIPIEIRDRIKTAIEYANLYREPYKIEMFKSVTPDIFNNISDTMLKLKCLGYNVEYIDGANRTDGTDSKLIIRW